MTAHLHEKTALDESVEGFCMARPTIYDIVSKGRKIGGAAIRKTKKGLLYQGSLCLGLPDRDFLEGVLKRASQVMHSMESASYPLSVDSALLEECIIQAITSAR
jgi:lipoate-protein ligase A